MLASLDGRIPLVIDAGATRIGLESTIVATAPDHVRLLRAGPVDAATIAGATGLPVRSAEVSGGAVEAPGQLASHYAPSKPLRLDAIDAEPDEWLIGFAAVAGHATLSAQGDLVEAAARLFDLLHQADAAPPPRIAVAPVPATGLGIAINDRLARAAAPRR